MAPRILLIGDYPPPHGGVAVHVKQLHDFLLARGLESKVLDIGKGRGPAPEVVPSPSLGCYGWHLARFAASGWLLHLHTSGNNPKAWLVAASVATAPGRGGKAITLHSGLIPAFLAASATHRALARVALAGFDRIIPVSPAIHASLVSLGVPGDRMELHPAFLASAVRPGPLPEGFAEARARRAPLVAYAHHPSPVYGRDVMLRALARVRPRMPDVGLFAFGPGALHDAAREAGVEEQLEAFGELPHPQALAALRACDVFVRPTRADGDSISVREALALGVPVVASDVAQRPQGTLLFKAGDPDALADRMVQAVAGGRVRAPTVDAGPALLRIYAGLGMTFRRSSNAAAG